MQIPLFYLYKLCIPFGYTVDYGTEQFGVLMSDPRSIGALVVFISVGVLAWHFRQRKSIIFFCIICYLITLIPVLHIFPTVPVVADRYAFLPSLPFVLIIASATAQLIAKRRTWLNGLYLLAIAGLSAISIQQNRVWENDKTLWEYTLTVNPRSTSALDILARQSFRNKDYTKALDLAKRASEINKNDFEYDRMRGELFLKERRPDLAVIMFESALVKNSESIEILISLGRAYEMLGNRQMAKRCYRDALNSQEVYLPGNMREKAALLLRLMEQ
jgi:tetratricopeptide (TPR) repeat protein